MIEKTKISIEMTGYKFEAEVGHDADIDEMVHLFKQLLLSHMFGEKCIEDAFYRAGFHEYEEVD